MKVILGLGNPGREYEATRHNVGWWVVDHLADVWHFDGWKRDGESLVASGALGNIKARLVKPTTFMNLSGAVLKPYLRKAFWAGATDLLVIVDDVAIPLGSIRLRAEGSAGGHNGLKSIEHALGNQKYGRMRIGIAPDASFQVADLAGFVLAPFGKIEGNEIKERMPIYTGAVETWMRDGMTAAMNMYNNK